MARSAFRLSLRRDRATSVAPVLKYQTPDRGCSRHSSVGNPLRERPFSSMKSTRFATTNFNPSGQPRASTDRKLCWSVLAYSALMGGLSVVQRSRQPLRFGQELGNCPRVKTLGLFSAYLV